FALDDSAAKPTFEEVPAPAVPSIEPLCILPIQVLAATAQREIVDSNQEVVMGPHQAVRQTRPAASPGLRQEHAKKGLAVGIVAEDLHPVDPMLGEVVRLSGDFKTRRPRHQPRVTHYPRHGNPAQWFVAKL